MTDETEPDEPTPEGSAGDVWARLRELEDVERSPASGAARAVDGSIADPGPPVDASGGAPSGPSGTTVGPVIAADSRPKEAPRYYVPAPSSPSPPMSTEAAAAKYRESQPGTPPQAPAAPGRRSRGAPPPAAPAARRSRRNPFRPKLKWFRPKLRWFFLYLPLLVMLLIGLTAFWGWRTFNDLHRVEMGDSIVPASDEFTNYLIVGSDSREGIDENTPNVGVIGTGTEVTGRRSDTIIVLRVGPDSAKMMSIPRDLWVTNVATGNKGRINASYAQGPDNLARSVTANLGIPIHHYVEVDFVSFAGMVDALGGIEIEFAHPTMDVNSGLAIPTAGVHRLDGSQALAYIRSRHFVEEIDGKPVPQVDGDIGRQARQQTFIRTVLSSVGGTRNPLKLARVSAAAAKGTRVDTEVGFFDMISLARQLAGVDPETVVLPTQNARKGQAAVLELRNAEAFPVLVGFGAGEE